MKDLFLFCVLGVGPGVFVLWGSWRVFKMVRAARGLYVDKAEKELRELRSGARYPREPR